jgi:hypothetical protein
MKFKRRPGEFEHACVLSESYTATDALPPILPACCWLVFVTRDPVRHPRLFFFSENLFVNRFVREPKFHCLCSLSGCLHCVCMICPSFEMNECLTRCSIKIDMDFDYTINVCTVQILTFCDILMTLLKLVSKGIANSL